MSITSLITINAILATLVVGGIVWFLGSAIRADKVARSARRAGPLPVPGRKRSDRIAA
jgi:hypothetical protein